MAFKVSFRPSAREVALNDVKLEDARQRATKSMAACQNMSDCQNGFMHKKLVNIEVRSIALSFINYLSSRGTGGFRSLGFSLGFSAFLLISPVLLRKFCKRNYARLEQRPRPLLHRLTCPDLRYILYTVNLSTLSTVPRQYQP